MKKGEEAQTGCKQGRGREMKPKEPRAGQKRALDQKAKEGVGGEVCTFAAERYGKEDIQSAKISEKAGRERFLGSDERIKFGNRGGEGERMRVERKAIRWNLLS